MLKEDGPLALVFKIVVLFSFFVIHEIVCGAASSHRMLGPGMRVQGSDGDMWNISVHSKPCHMIEKCLKSIAVAYTFLPEVCMIHCFKKTLKISFHAISCHTFFLSIVKHGCIIFSIKGHLVEWHISSGQVWE